MMKPVYTIKLIFMKLIFILFIMVSPQIFAEKKQAMSLEEAAEFVRKSSKGKILSARTTKYKGETSHRIQVLTPSGRVKIIQVPIYKFKSNKNYESDNYRNSSETNSSENYRSQRQKRPSRYQKPNLQNTTPTMRPSLRPNNTPTMRPSIRPNNRPSTRPNYQKPRQPNIKQEQSGNKDK